MSTLKLGVSDKRVRRGGLEEILRRAVVARAARWLRCARFVESALLKINKCRVCKKRPSSNLSSLAIESERVNTGEPLIRASFVPRFYWSETYLHLVADILVT